MKRCWLGVGLLALFLVLGLVSSDFLARFGDRLSREAEQAAALTETDRAGAEEHLRQVRASWQEKRFWLTVLSDHEPIREAEVLFALLESPSDDGSFRENALRLSQILLQLGQSQKPKPENIF